jgi:hypothetical protein
MSMHIIRLFPLPLSGTAFNWFVSLAPNSVHTWEHLEQKFHEYFYNGETELRLSHLAAVRQRHNETVAEYMWRFRDTQNKCCSLTIGEKDLAELVFAVLISTLKDRLEGQYFLDTGQVLQRAVIQENRAKEHKPYGRFKDAVSKEKPVVNCVGESKESDEETEVCIAEWVDMAKGKPLACSFLKTSPSKREEVKFTFDMNKCDKLFDVPLQNNVIKLIEGHVIPLAGQLS